MAKRIKQRALVGVLGKALTRRSRGRCELCGGREEPRPYELTPYGDAPDPERTLMGCTRCRHWLETGGVDPVEARFLSSAVWSEEPAVRLAAGRLLRMAEGQDDRWWVDAMEVVDVDPETGEIRA